MIEKTIPHTQSFGCNSVVDTQCHDNLSTLLFVSVVNKLHLEPWVYLCSLVDMLPEWLQYLYSLWHLNNNEITKTKKSFELNSSKCPMYHLISKLNTPPETSVQPLSLCEGKRHLKYQWHLPPWPLSCVLRGRQSEDIKILQHTAGPTIVCPQGGHSVDWEATWASTRLVCSLVCTEKSC